MSCWYYIDGDEGGARGRQDGRYGGVGSGVVGYETGA